MPINKVYINAQELLDDAFELGLMIVESDFKPDIVVGVWRGGSPVAIAIHEVLQFAGMNPDHIAIRTSSYTGVDQRTEVSSAGLDYIFKNLPPDKSILIVDDVFDTGLSLDHVCRELHQMYNGKPPHIKIATPYFKPENNKTSRIPDFYLHEASQWLVFPHELQGLNINELAKNKPGIEKIKQRLLNLNQ